MRFVFLLILFAVTGCKFKTSPYTADVGRMELNSEYLREISNSEASAPTTFKIAFISDTHNFYDELQAIVDRINSNGPYAFVVVTGDVTNFGLLDEFRQTDKILSKLKYPYIIAIGNHDLLANGGVIFSRLYGDDQFVLTYKNIYLVVFNNNNWEMGGDYPDISWVQTQLALAPPGAQKILAAHVSLQDRDRFSSGEIAQWENLVSSNSVAYVMVGHDHNPVIRSFGGATAITIGAPSKKIYVELNVTPGGVTHQQVRF